MDSLQKWQVMGKGRSNAINGCGHRRVIMVAVGVLVPNRHKATYNQHETPACEEYPTINVLSYLARVYTDVSFNVPLSSSRTLFRCYTTYCAALIAVGPNYYFIITKANLQMHTPFTNLPHPVKLELMGFMNSTRGWIGIICVISLGNYTSIH